MKSCEDLITQDSDYFIYSPSKVALDTFLYPMQCGVFTYLPGYSLCRDSFDSFLLMYIQKGDLMLTFGGVTQRVTANNFVLIDCYKRHSYSSEEGCKCLWCHFDGITARAYYNNVILHLGNVFSLPDAYTAMSKLSDIFKIFYNGELVREPLLSKYLTDILTEFLLYMPNNFQSHSSANMTGEIITYINENFANNITVEKLAARAGLSQYHFIRTFKRETGFTPHEYIVNTRIATAKYLLKSTQLPIKEICFTTGFSCESVFCGAFKRYQGVTPTQYRLAEEFRTK